MRASWDADGKSVLVEGFVLNLSESQQRLPEVRLVLRNAQGEVLHEAVMRIGDGEEPARLLAPATDTQISGRVDAVSEEAVEAAIFVGGEEDLSSTRS